MENLLNFTSQVVLSKYGTSTVPKEYNSQVPTAGRFRYLININSRIADPVRFRQDPDPENLNF